MYDNVTTEPAESDQHSIDEASVAVDGCNATDFESDRTVDVS